MIAKIVHVLTGFDIEYKPALIILCCIIGIYAGISSFEFYNEHEDCENFGNTGLKIGYCGDFVNRQNLLHRFEWTLDDLLDNTRHPFAVALVKLSGDLTGDYRTFSFISSGLILALTYFISRKITGVNYIGLLSVGIVVTSSIFYTYDVIMTYPNFWVTALLGSIYLGLRNSSSSSALFLLSIPFKAITILYIPAMFFFFKFSNMEKRIKYAIYVSCLAVAVLFVLAFFFSDNIKGDMGILIQPEEFLWWLGMWTVEFKDDRISLILVMLCIMGMYMIRKVPYAKSILFFMLFTLIQPAIISGFTTFTNEDYRMLPLVVFAAIGFGFMLVNSDKLIYEMQRFQSLMVKSK